MKRIVSILFAALFCISISAQVQYTTIYQLPTASGINSTNDVLLIVTNWLTQPKNVKVTPKALVDSAITLNNPFEGGVLVYSNGSRYWSAVTNLNFPTNTTVWSQVNVTNLGSYLYGIKGTGSSTTPQLERIASTDLVDYSALISLITTGNTTNIANVYNQYGYAVIDTTNGTFLWKPSTGTTNSLVDVANGQLKDSNLKATIDWKAQQLLSASGVVVATWTNNTFKVLSGDLIGATNIPQSAVTGLTNTLALIQLAVSNNFSTPASFKSVNATNIISLYATNLVTTTNTFVRNTSFWVTNAPAGWLNLNGTWTQKTADIANYFYVYTNRNSTNFFIYNNSATIKAWAFCRLTNANSTFEIYDANQSLTIYPKTDITNSWVVLGVADPGVTTLVAQGLYSYPVLLVTNSLSQLTLGGQQLIAPNGQLTYFPYNVSLAPNMISGGVLPSGYSGVTANTYWTLDWAGLKFFDTTLDNIGYGSSRATYDINGMSYGIGSTVSGIGTPDQFILQSGSWVYADQNRGINAFDLEPAFNVFQLNGDGGARINLYGTPSITGFDLTGSTTLVTSNTLTGQINPSQIYPPVASYASGTNGQLLTWNGSTYAPSNPIPVTINSNTFSGELNSSQIYPPITGGASVAAGSGITITIVGGTNFISLYTAPTITSLINNQISVEKGTTISSTILTWVLAGGTITSQSLNNGIGSLLTALRTYTDLTSYSTSRTYTLTIADTQTTNTANTSITFYDKIYWGTSTNTSLIDGQVIALSSQFATTRDLTKSIITSGDYIYIAYPASFGAATFVVGGFADAGWTLVTRTFINASGGSSSYNIYRHTLATTGTYTVVVQ